MLTYRELKERECNELKERNSFSLRIHRALSWLNKSEKSQGDPDSQVIFLWISFNAAYANDIDLGWRPKEYQLIDQFIESLCELDGKGKLYNMVWVEYSNNIKFLLNNEYVFQPFWDYVNGKCTDDEWREMLSIAMRKANSALGKLYTAT